MDSPKILDSSDDEDVTESGAIPASTSASSLAAKFGVVANEV
jgi:hypothetical protein